MSKDAPQHSRKTLWLVAAVCIAPFIASFVAYYFYKPEGRVNYGELMDARQLSRTPMTLADGAAFSLKQLEGKWLFVVADDATCDAYCEKKLWQIRQVRKTQGKYPERIERVWLITGAGESLAGRLLVYDALSAVTRTVRVAPDPHCPSCAGDQAGGV